MRKLTTAILIVLTVIMFGACAADTSAKEENKTDDEVIINIPTQNSSVNSNAENSKNESSVLETDVENNSQQILYYANTNSKKFHKNSCRYASIIDNSRLYITESREELISENYQPCKVCNP
ncbi:MAG: hypothetical protein IJZ75_02610 [Clostridia bacterium]|nr:hypothetical protein [Clostridia bacterium]